MIYEDLDSENHTIIFTLSVCNSVGDNNPVGELLADQGPMIVSSIIMLTLAGHQKTDRQNEPVTEKHGL